MSTTKVFPIFSIFVTGQNIDHQVEIQTFKAAANEVRGLNKKDKTIIRQVANSPNINLKHMDETENSKKGQRISKGVANAHDLLAGAKELEQPSILRVIQGAKVILGISKICLLI